MLLSRLFLSTIFAWAGNKPVTDVGLLEALGIRALSQGLWVWHPMASAWAGACSLAWDLLPWFCAWSWFGKGLFPAVLCPGRVSLEHPWGQQEGELWSEQQRAMRQVKGDSREEKGREAWASLQLQRSPPSSPSLLDPHQRLCSAPGEDWSQKNTAAEKYLDIFLGMLTWPLQNLGIWCPEWAGA